MRQYGCSNIIRLISKFALTILITTGSNAWAAVVPHDTAGVDRLQNAASGGAAISFDRATGTVSFLRLEPGSVKINTGVRASKPETTLAFLNSYGSIFGLQNPAEELELLRETTDNFGYSHVFYRQVYQGVPVFGSDFRSHFDRSGALTRISATTIPIRHLDPIPRLDADQAEAAATAEVKRALKLREPALDLMTGSPELVVFRTGLLQGVAGRNHLAYRVEVINANRSIREFVFIDAHSANVLDQITGIHHAINRQIYNGGFNPGFLVWSEGDSLPFAGSDEVGINNLIDYAEDSYNLFMTISNGTYASYDAADSTMHSVLNDPAISCPNASWNGVSTNYCNGVTGDDTVTHEWTHAYSDFTHNLIYQWQSGALNESYSDIFGEVVDMLNGAGTDSPLTIRTTDGSACSTLGRGVPASDISYRWLSGEDDPSFGGAIRDLWRPECYNDPGRVSSANYWCSTIDSGGVHTNSGIPNHAYALMVDGGDYNGQQISDLGMTRATHIYWRAMTIYQAPASNFSAHADALESSCGDLVGADLPELSTDSSTPAPSGIMISASDCTEVSKIITAVELRNEPTQCNFMPLLENNPPVRCTDYGDLQSISLTDWESGLGSWTFGTHDITNPDTFDTPDWAVVDSLPNQRAGKAAFVADLQAGDCIADDETGALTLDSPPIVIPEGTEVPRISVDHWMATEPGWDGGNFKISVNNGGFVLIPATAIEVSPYNGALNPAPNNTNPLAGESAFTGTDSGSLSGSWGQSHINLLGIAAAGDSVQLRFDFGVDGCTGRIGWYVDEVEFYSCPNEVGEVIFSNGFE